MAAFRVECDLRDCEVEGRVPVGLNGTFYRVGPDFQYPSRAPHNVPFDGEGHVSMFRFADGHVDFKSRYVRTQRFKAQAAARKSLFGMYRNPLTDDPVVAGLSRGTANTHIVHHNGRLLALKEDSPPVLMDPDTLETLDDYHTFGGKLRSRTFTAHPKFDVATGEMIAFGYEAAGFASDDVSVFAVDRHGEISWETWIKVPYAGMLHDFAVTERHIALFVTPMVTNMELIKRGGPHFAWDSSLPTWLGVMRRGGDGSDLRWFKGPERFSSHVMGAFSDGERLYVDMQMSLKHPYAFFPNLHGEPFDPVVGSGRVTRVSVDLAKKDIETYDMEVMYSQTGYLPRQDDRYNTVPYRYGFMNVTDSTRPLQPGMAGFRGANCFVRFDHQTRRTSTFATPDGANLSEPCFVPRSASAPEGEGYLLGVVHALRDGGRTDLLILDAEHLEDGPMATVKLPVLTNTQVHGWWMSAQNTKIGE